MNRKQKKVLIRILISPLVAVFAFRTANERGTKTLIPSF